MKSRFFCLFLSTFCFLPFPLVAQKTKAKEPERKIVFNVKDNKDDKMFLVIHFRDKFMLKDSAFTKGNGVFVFEGENKLDEGMYSLVSGGKARLLDFMMDGSQKFTYNLDTTGNVNKYSVVGSPENAEMLLFQQTTVEAKKQMKEWGEKRKEFEEKEMQDSVDYYLKKMKDKDAEMERFITDLMNLNPTFLFSKLQKSFREVEIPEAPVLEDGTIDSSFRAIYFRTHYWDNFDMTDRRFLFMPSFDPKLNNYIKRILWYQPVDTINKYIDLMLDKTSPDSLMYRYTVEFVSREFETSKIIGHDAVFVHIAKNNQLAGKCTWLDEDIIKKYKMVIEDKEPLLIGKKTVEMILPDTSQTEIFGHWISSYKMPNKYRILWFYDQNCATCKKEALEMKAVYDSLENIGKRNFDVYAVNRTDDIEGWKKYIRTNGYTWINVGGAKGNVDWKEAFRITSNPQFYIINQEHIIILNKNIPKDMITTFLEDYERIESEKERLKNRKQ